MNPSQRFKLCFQFQLAPLHLESSSARHPFHGFLALRFPFAHQNAECTESGRSSESTEETAAGCNSDVGVTNHDAEVPAGSTWIASPKDTELAGLTTREARATQSRLPPRLNLRWLRALPAMPTPTPSRSRSRSRETRVVAAGFSRLPSPAALSRRPSPRACWWTRCPACALPKRTAPTRGVASGRGLHSFPFDHFRSTCAYFAPVSSTQAYFVPHVTQPKPWTCPEGAQVEL